MTREIFSSWLYDWDHELISKRTKIFLLIDNCPAYQTAYTPKNIELIYFSKNAIGNLRSKETRDSIIIVDKRNNFEVGPNIYVDENRPKFLQIPDQWF